MSVAQAFPLSLMPLHWNAVTLTYLKFSQKCIYSTVYSEWRKEIDSHNAVAMGGTEILFTFPDQVRYNIIKH